jgi:hypothetical protein
MGTVIPFYPSGHKSPVLTFNPADPERALLFTTCFTSFVFDFVLRQSLSGPSLALYILKQLPMPEPESIEDSVVKYEGEERSLKRFLIDNGLRLVWSSHALDPLGTALGRNDGPFEWDEEDRRARRAKIDAAIAQLYGLSKEEFSLVLDSFEILEEQERETYDHFRRKEECLDAFDGMTIRNA